MAFKQLVSLLMAFLLLLPSTPAWSQGQRLEDQAQFYLQNIGPGPGPTSQPPALTSAPIRPELQRQAPTAPQPAQILTTAPRQTEEISEVERRAWSNRMFLKQFGYSFFFQPPASFLPVEAIPVGPDYVIGPGDRIKIIIWGSVQGEYSLTVDRNGQIDIPKVGVVHVSSLTFRQLREVLDREFARQYTNFQMNVTLDNLRTIPVYVVGQARFPGSYAVSSLSTLVSALFASGGPSKSGSMRNIQVRRGGKVITHFDMYGLFLRGDKSKDIRLQPEDVIFIPPIGPLAAIGTPKTVKEVDDAFRTLTRMQPPSAGLKAPAEVGLKAPAEVGTVQASEENLQAAIQKIVTSNGLDLGGPVKVPGIYELENERSLSDLLRLAGGLGDTAFKGRVQVLRVQNGQAMILFDDDLFKILSRQPDFRIMDGDFVEIFPVPSLVEKKVVVAGAVKNPGEFGFRDNMRVSDLVAYAGGVLQQADMSEAEITRVTITPPGPETTRLNIRLFAALNNVPRDNIILKPNDYLFIRTLPDWDINKTVQISGEVKSPGTYSLKKGETLSSVLTRAGGFTDRAYLLGAALMRQSTKEIQKKQLTAAIDRLEARLAVISAQKAQPLAGAAEQTAEGAAISTQGQMLIAALRKVEPLGRVVIHLDDPERLRGTPDDIILEDGDRLMIPQTESTVNVVGAVFAPTALVYAPSRTVNKYLTMAGGTTSIADGKEIYVVKANGVALSRQGFSWSWLGTTYDGTKYGYHPGGLGSLTLDPGDTIVVPERLERRFAWLSDVKDIATILGNIALTTGVVLVGLRTR
jgi:protein involved in polysaccharide export with SLBB domain